MVENMRHFGHKSLLMTSVWHTSLLTHRIIITNQISEKSNHNCHYCVYDECKHFFYLETFSGLQDSENNIIWTDLHICDMLPL